MKRPFLFARSGPFFSTLSIALCLSAVAEPVRSQCFPRWKTTDTGVNGDVFALVALDEDGPGGLRPSVFAGGAFTEAGGVAASHVARWNGFDWTPVGAGMDGDVRALAVFDDGGPLPSLIAAGSFTIADGNPAGGIAKWDGTAWSSLGGGMDGSVFALASFDPDGSNPNPPVLVAGGSFTLAGGVAASSIAKWDGTAWSPIGSGTNGAIHALASNGLDLYAGGSFSTAGGTPASNIAKWRASSGWDNLGAGANGIARALAVSDDDGQGPHQPGLFAGGDFAAPPQYIARWSGFNWSAVGLTNGPVHALAVHDDDDDGAHRRKLYAGGLFSTAGNSTVYNVAEYDGVQWLPLGYGTDATVHALAPFDDFAGGALDPALYAGGSFTTAAQAPAAHIAAWTSCGSSIRSFCFGDGTGSSCPCGNVGKSQTGCNSSIGVGGASLVTIGSARLSNDTLQFVSGLMVPQSQALLMESSAVHGAQFFGDGLMCLTGTINALFVDVAGSSSIAFPPAGANPIHVQSALFGTPIAPGTSRYYQVRYRDPTASFCPPPVGSDWNLSSGVAIVWYP